MNCKLFLVATCLLAIVTTDAAGQRTQKVIALDLDEAIEMALEDNEQVLISQNDVREAGQLIREAWADALPQVNFAGLYTRNFRQPVFFFPDSSGQQRAFRIGSKNSYMMSLTVDQPLFQAGKVSGGIKAANLFKKVSREGFRSVKGEITLAVKKSYYTVQLNQQLLAINRQSLEQQYAILEKTRKLFQQGQVSELDTLTAWVDYSNLQPAVMRSENNLQLAKNNLKELIGLELGQEITLVTELDFEQTNGIVLDQVEQEALRNRPEMKQLEYQAEMLEKNIRISRAELLPKLFLNGTYESIAQSEQLDFGMGFQSSISGSIRLEVPIFNGFRNFAKVEQAKIDYQNARYQEQMFKDNVKIEVESLLLKIREAEKRVQVQRHAIKQAERALFMAERRYSEGVSTRLEVGDALLSLNLTKTNYVQAVYDHKIALAEMHKAIGRI